MAEAEHESEVPAHAPGRGRMLRSAVTISSGHLAAQLLMVLGAPALSRLYRPEDFNVLGVYVALLTVLGPLITLRFEPALMLIGRPRHGAVHAGGVMLLSGLTSLLAAGTIWLLQRPLRPWLAMDLSPQLCAAVALGFWAFACYQVSSMLLIRRGEFRRLAQQRVIYSAATLGAQLWLGWRTPSPAGIVFAVALGYAAATLPWLPGILAAGRPFGRRVFRLQAAMMYQYRKYPQVDVIGAMLWAFNVQGPVLLAALAFGPAVGGEFSLAFKALATPATLGAYSLSRVYHREAAARRADPDQLSRLFASCLRRGLLFSGVLCGAAALVSPRAFPPIFGAEWQRAGVLCSMIAPLLAAQILTTILSPTFDVLQRQERRLYQEVVTGLALIAGLGLGWALGWTPAGAVLSMSLAGSLGHAYSIFSAWREIRHLGGAASCSAPPTSLRRAA